MTRIEVKWIKSALVALDDNPKVAATILNRLAREAEAEHAAEDANNDRLAAHYPGHHHRV